MYWYLYFVCFLLFFVVYQQQKRRHRINRKHNHLKKKGKKKIMPQEMIKECIGKEVVICVEGELSAFQATVISVEENWIKVEEKSKIRYINGDMITQIYINKKKQK